ncbi:MAG: hypothetical protein WBB18_04965 [Nodosilinea sp.]
MRSWCRSISELFYREGVHSIGIDRIIAESGMAKMSLYDANLPNPEDLAKQLLVLMQGPQWSPRCTAAPTR